MASETVFASLAQYWQVPIRVSAPYSDNIAEYFSKRVSLLFSNTRINRISLRFLIPSIKEFPINAMEPQNRISCIQNSYQGILKQAGTAFHLADFINHY